MDKTVTRAMLSERAVMGNGVSRRDSAEIAERMFLLIGEALMAGETVKLAGFGSLQVRSRAQRMGRNPRTGEEHPIAPHHTVMFIPSARLRTALDSLNGTSFKSPAS